MASIDPKIIEDLKSKHGDIVVVRAAGEEIVARHPTGAEYRRFRASSFDEKKRATAAENLARACVVYPDANAFDALLERKPALADVVGGKLLEAAGADDEAEVAKP